MLCGSRNGEIGTENSSFFREYLSCKIIRGFIYRYGYSDLAKIAAGKWQNVQKVAID